MTREQSSLGGLAFMGQQAEEKGGAAIERKYERESQDWEREAELNEQKEEFEKEKDKNDKEKNLKPGKDL